MSNGSPEIKVSIFASAIRPGLWNDFFKSLESTSVSYEIVFAGPLRAKDMGINVKGDILERQLDIYGRNFKYIMTANLKPAQCYEIARRHCTGETISWSADDCVYSEDFFGKAYKYWKALGNDKVALSIQTIEDNLKHNMNDHSFIGFDRSTALMAPVNLMSRKVLDELGGYDRRFICGQAENDAIMMLYEIGGSVIIFDEAYCTIDHIKKHGKEHSFRAGYTKDREVLEKIWGKRGELLHTGKSLRHEPYHEKDILVRSQNNNNPSIWA